MTSVVFFREINFTKIFVKFISRKISIPTSGTEGARTKEIKTIIVVLKKDGWISMISTGVISYYPHQVMR